MARYEVTGPDGGRYEVTAPDDMSEADLTAQINQQLGLADPATATAAPEVNPGKFANRGMRDTLPPDWSDIPGEAIRNLPESAKNFAVGLAQPILHPIETAKSIKDIAVGLASKSGNMLGIPQDPEAKAEREKAINALGQFLKDRYGSIDGIKKTLARDPVGVLADASVVLTGGGAVASRLPGASAAMGRALGTAGNAVDPLRMAAYAGRGGRQAVEHILGVTTGAGSTPMQMAYQAGRTNNPALREHMRGQRPLTEVVDMADNAVGQLTRERGAAYRQGQQALQQNPGPVNFQPVRDAHRVAGDDIHFQGIVKDAGAADVHNRLGTLINDFMALPPQQRTAEALDALKQALGEVRQQTQPGTLARRTADQVYHSARNEISNQVPSYRDTMRGYADATENLREIRGTLSLGEKAMTDTTLRKLQSTMRNNVNTNYGHRQTLVDQLARHEPDLPYALAGQALNSVTPRGLAVGGAGIHALYGMASNPWQLMALPAASPRAMGEVLHGMGQGSRLAGAFMDRFGASPQGIDRAFLMDHALNQVTQAPREESMGLSGTIRPKGAYTYGLEE